MDLTFEQSEQGNREPVKLLGEELERVTHFRYIVMSIEEEGGMATEITKRVGADWINWKKWGGALYDRRTPAKRTGPSPSVSLASFYKTVTRPAMLYGAETQATTKKQE